MEYIVLFFLAVFVIILGAINTTGNISSLHWYHRQRVTEEDRLPFGRLVGAGTMLIGASIGVFGVLKLIYDNTQSLILLWCAGFVLAIGIIVGLALSFWAMIKYNKGIF